jgi:hypothetical protein
LRFCDGSAPQEHFTPEPGSQRSCARTWLAGNPHRASCARLDDPGPSSHACLKGLLHEHPQACSEKTRYRYQENLYNNCKVNSLHKSNEENVYLLYRFTKLIYYSRADRTTASTAVVWPARLAELLPRASRGFAGAETSLHKWLIARVRLAEPLPPAS